LWAKVGSESKNGCHTEKRNADDLRLVERFDLKASGDVDAIDKRPGGWSPLGRAGRDDADLGRVSIWYSFRIRR